MYLNFIGEKTTLINNILRRKVNCFGNIIRRYCLLHDVIEEEMIEVKGVGRRTQIPDDLRNRRCWKLEKEAKDRKRWKVHLSYVYKQEIKVIFHKSTDQLISSMLNN